MVFENVIKKLSAFVAFIVVFLFASGIYLSAKGFVMDENGNIFLMKSANAAEAMDAEQEPVKPVVLDKNIVFPQNHFVGKADAPVTIYEYSSLGCFHCADFHLNVIPKIKKNYVDKGLVRIMFSDFPIDKKSMMASMMARCMSDDKYFDFLALMFKKQKEWNLSNNPEKVLIKYATLNGLSKEKAEACLKDDAVAQNIMEARQQAITVAGIRGTPSFIISNKDGNEIIQGQQSYDAMDEILKEKLATK